MLLEPKQTQKEMIHNHLQKYGKIDVWTCYKKYRITRPSQYILLLRREGYPIETFYPLKKNGKKEDYCIYILKKP
jgi:hypothetical protein